MRFEEMPAIVRKGVAMLGAVAAIGAFSYGFVELSSGVDADTGATETTHVDAADNTECPIIDVSDTGDC